MIVCVIRFQKIFARSGTMVTLLHLINNWQMNPDRKRTLLAALLLSAACIFAVTAARADEPQVKDVAAAKAGTVFRDCPDCSEMVVIPAGSFNMGSPDSEKVWATKHGASPESVSDEAPQHRVTLRSFAIGKYDVTRSSLARPDIPQVTDVLNQACRKRISTRMLIGRVPDSIKLIETRWCASVGKMHARMSRG